MNVRIEHLGIALDVQLRPQRTPTSIKEYDIETVFHGADDITALLSEEAIDGIESAALAAASNNNDEEE